MTARFIPRSLWRRLRRVRASRDGLLHLRPCRALLKDGRFVDRVYLVEEEAYLRVWRTPPGEDPARRALPIEAVADVAESPTRLPARIADRLYRAGESGRDYTVFTLILASGRRLHYQTGHAVDFPQWPDDVTPDLVADVLPHQAPADFRRRTPAPHEASAAHLWCLYRRPPARWPRVAAALWAILTWVAALVQIDLGRSALDAAGALRLVIDLVRGAGAPGGGILRGAPWVVAVLMHSGLILAPLMRRRRARTRLAIVGLMLPSLVLAPLLLRDARLGFWVAGEPRAQLWVALALWMVSILNAALLLLPLRRLRRCGPAPEPAASQVPAAESGQAL